MVEVLIGMGLLLLLLSLFFTILVPTLKYTSRDSVKVEMQQSANFTLKRIEKDLQQTVTAGLSFLDFADDSEPTALSLVRFSDVTAAGNLAWEQRAIVYYREPSTRELLLKVWTPSSPSDTALFSISRPTKLSVSKITEVLTDPDVSGKPMATDVSLFRVGHPELPVGGGELDYRVCRISLGLERRVPRQVAPLRFHVQRDFYLRNGL